MDIIIREGTLNDLDAIRSLFYETVVTFDRTYYTDRQVEKWIGCVGNPANWPAKIRADKYLVAENTKKEIIGFSSLQQTGSIDMLYVKPTAQKKGVATRLLQGVCDLADMASLGRVYTEAGLASVAFFEKNGFFVQQARARELEGVHFTKIELVKRLWLM